MTRTTAPVHVRVSRNESPARRGSMCLPDVTGKMPEKNQPLHTGGEVQWITPLIIIFFVDLASKDGAAPRTFETTHADVSGRESDRSQKGVTAIRPISKLYKLARLLRYLYKAFTTAATYRPGNK